jgi:polar amino acid transport system substrate-binding protein
MLISQQGDILLSDFGIAAVNPSLPHETRRAQRGLQGTVDYMAPELFDWHPSPKSDQYALAVVAYEWLCGNIPFGAETLFGLIQQHRQEPPPSLTQRMPTISPEIEQVVFRALAKDPAARFPKIQDFALALSDACGIPRIRALTASSGIATLATSSSNQAAPSIVANPDQVPPVQAPARRSARRAFLIAGLATGLIALGGGTAWWSNAVFWRDSATPSPTVGLIESKGLLTPGVLLWGADPGLGGAPYVFLDANSAPFGFEVDIANAIAQRMAISQECYQTQYTWLEDNLRSHKIDIILNGWEVTPDRRQDEAFSAPYYRYGQQLVVRANDSRFSRYTASSQITLKEVSKYRFGTGADYKAADLLRAAGINPHTSEVPLDDIDKGIVDIVMVDTPIVAYYVQGKGIEAAPSRTLRPIGKPLFGDSTSNYVIGFRKNDPNAEILRKEIDQVLLILKQDGTLKRIYQQWGLWNDLQKEVGIT